MSTDMSDVKPYDRFDAEPDALRKRSKNDRKTVDLPRKDGPIRPIHGARHVSGGNAFVQRIAMSGWR
ncbi:hypothetical protein DIE15_23585 [Burkholderia sp. Bp9031]|uniref:hypothetical protein n=1 Tax=Burkholderia sp. Bp9031 TaxID=2184566 RepID=UPI000F5FF3EA|nr:hypothetical protein [Burkholderia sp. Bp9031]RQZ12396.1 hypothetical protein DIE15_23585 [Burkholderia sp. Bp9031]